MVDPANEMSFVARFILHVKQVSMYAFQKYKNS